MKKSTVVSLFAIAALLGTSAAFAEDKAQVKTMNSEIVFVPNRSCNELPADLQSHSIKCDQVTMGKRSYAKVTVGYAPLERQAMQNEDLAFQHGG